jgi:hypothetical protein
VCVSGCVTARCGDGFVRSGVEDCDNGGAIDSAQCDSDCTAAACGDGYVNSAAGEECDGLSGCSGAETCVSCRCS